MAKKDKAPRVRVVQEKRTRGSSVAQRLMAKVDRTRLRPLTMKEQRFVQEFVANDGEISLREAAIRAGYTTKDASGIASDLTNPAKNPSVVAAIQDYRSELNAKYGTTFERHMRDLQRIRDAALAAGAFGAAVSAEYRRGQALGTIYIDRKEVRVGTIDSMSKEEVEAKLREIKLMFVGASPDVLNITPDRITIEHEPEFTVEDIDDGNGDEGIAAIPEAEGQPAWDVTDEDREQDDTGLP